MSKIRHMSNCVHLCKIDINQYDVSILELKCNLSGGIQTNSTFKRMINYVKL